MGSQSDASGPSATSAVSAAWRRFGVGSAVVAAVVLTTAWLSAAGAIPVTLVGFAESVFYLVTLIFLAYFTIAILFLCRTSLERRRVAVCFILCVGAAMFWSGFEQAGSSMNLFTRDLTDRRVLGTEITAAIKRCIHSITVAGSLRGGNRWPLHSGQ